MAYNLLKGKKGIIFGALNDQSIAWKAALKAHEEGAELVLTNTPVSIRLGTINELAEQCNALVVPADATSLDDLGALVDAAMEHFGGQFDFVLHSVGMSPNIRKNKPYEDTNYDFFGKTLDISALSFHKLLNVLYKKDALKEWGSAVALTYIAAQRTFQGYNDMALRKEAPRKGQHRFPVAHQDDRRQRHRRHGGDVHLRRQDVASRQRLGFRLRRLHRLAVLGPHEACDHAEPLSRRRFLVRGTHLRCDRDIHQGAEITRNTAAFGNTARQDEQETRTAGFANPAVRLYSAEP